MASITISALIAVVNAAVPETLLGVSSRAVQEYLNHEPSFITLSAPSSIQTKTFSQFYQYAYSLARALRAWGKPTGSIVIYLTEHEENIAAVWSCLLAGHVPCLQLALSTQHAHKEGHVNHIKNLFSSAIWLTSESGADQLQSILVSTFTCSLSSRLQRRP